MEETRKLFSQKAISVATFFGGPAAGTYLIKKNYEAFGQSDKGNKAFLLGIVFTLLLFAALFSLPEHIIDRIPNSVLPAIYTVIIYLIVDKVQGQRLKDHEESGGIFHSIWKAVGIGAIFLVALLALIFGIIYSSGGLNEPDFDATTYDLELAQFTKNESESIAVFEVIGTAEPEYLIEEFSKGILLWEENTAIVHRLNAMENLPEELQEQNKKLLRYCELRIQHNKIIIKAISEDSDEYVAEMEEVAAEMTEVLNALE